MEDWQRQIEQRKKIEQLKAGDKVWIGSSPNRRMLTVERITDTQIVLEDGLRFYRKVQSNWNFDVGRQVGAIYLEPVNEHADEATAA